MMPQTQFPLCKRGVFGLNSWRAQRRPGSEQQPFPPTQQPQQNSSRTKSSTQEVSSVTPTKNGTSCASNRTRLLAKYSYTANPTSPLGEELTFKQGDRLTLHSDENSVWWLAEDASGRVAFAPASYLMVEEEKPSTGGLPWLQNREEPPVVAAAASMTTAFGRPESGVKVKPYQSAYNRDRNDNSVNEKYYCDVCDKQLNGPQPYKAHMASRGHKEEVQYQASRK